MNSKFTRSFLGFFALATLGTAVLPTQVQASTIVLNSGQGLTPSVTDTNITYWTLGVPVSPLSPPFTAADFLKAQGIGCSGPDIWPIVLTYLNQPSTALRSRCIGQ